MSGTTSQFRLNSLQRLFGQAAPMGVQIAANRSGLRGWRLATAPYAPKIHPSVSEDMETPTRIIWPPPVMLITVSAPTWATV